MAILHHVLGLPGRDNAVLARIDTGQGNHRVLFDCGQGCLEELAIAEIKQIEHVFFSHFHMDHVAGFDFLFRLNYDRPTAPIHIWGPVGTCDLMAHRFQGFTWNLHANRPGEWIAHEITGDGVRTEAFLTREAFRIRHPRAHDPDSHLILRQPEFTVSAVHLDHGMPCLGYVLRETPSINIDVSGAAALGLQPGRWMQSLKVPDAEGAVTGSDGRTFPLSELRRQLVRVTPGGSLAYLTDFRLPEVSLGVDVCTLGPIVASSTTGTMLSDGLADLVEAIRGCDVLVCEAQYREGDVALARANRHMTAAETAALARAAEIKQLVLFHVSDRYDDAARAALLDEARAVFANAAFPVGWGVCK